MQTINFGSALSFDETVTLIASCPEIRVHVEGEPGIGKSSMLPHIARKAGISRYAYIDASQLSEGDAAMPVIKHDTQTTGFYPNEAFGLHHGEPVVIMIDEMPKASQSIQNFLHPLFEEHNPRFGSKSLPAGSIVFSTGNLTTDGVGDNTKMHTINRQTRVRQRKPTNEEWIHNYAVNAGVEGSLIAWADKTPHAFASYLDDGQEDNFYIFNPRRPGKPFFSPRSASRASHIIRQRHEIGANAMTCALIGTIGEQAARDISAYIEYQNELPAWRDIVENPRGAHVPSSAGAAGVLVFGAVQRVEADTIDAVMQYLERFDTNWQATFCLTLAKSAKQRVGFSNKSYTKWLADNQDLL